MSVMVLEAYRTLQLSRDFLLALPFLFALCIGRIHDLRHGERGHDSTPSRLRGAAGRPGAGTPGIGAAGAIGAGAGPMELFFVR
jgi:hypothetical protein